MKGRKDILESLPCSKKKLSYIGAVRNCIYEALKLRPKNNKVESTMIGQLMTSRWQLNESLMMTTLSKKR